MAPRPSKVVLVETIGDYRMRVVKFQDEGSALFAFGVILDPVMDSLTPLIRDLLGWGVDTSKPRWLVEVCGGPIKATRTVRTRFTRLGARRAANEVRRVLSSGDPRVIGPLPDLTPRTGFPW